ncbi:MAG: xanthine/uracil/vitamin C permease [Acidobacteriota bacterium]|nr:xanthine/uracil/vitamin C permease [Acidobacteriota bacterium]
MSATAETKFHYPVFARSDFSAFWALFTDNFTNLLVISGVCKFVFDMPNEIVFGRIIPGASFAILVGVCFYSWLAHRLARREQRTDVTALPYGISTPVMFVYLFGVIGPIYFSTNDALLAWQVGLGAGFMGGLVAAAGALVGPFIKRVTPRAGMLGTLSGIALVFIGVTAMALVFESPIIGFISLTIILWGLVGRYKLPFDIPAGLLALGLGTVVALAMGTSSISTEGVAFYLPLPYFGDMIVGIKHLFANSELFLVLIPVQIYNFIETMNNVESAEAKGDKYPVGAAMAFDGAGTCLSAIFGSPFPTTVYIGHPGYKRIHARAGYTLGVGVVLTLASMFGLLAFLANLVPLAATAPILIYIAMTLISESAASVPRTHAMAIAVAMMPHVSELLMVKWNSMLQALRDFGAEKLPAAVDTPEFVAQMSQQGARVLGQETLAQGSIITGMIWGGFTALIIDGKFRNAGMFALAAAAMSSVGILHGPALHAPDLSPVVVGYLIMGIFLIVYPMTTEVKPLYQDDLAEKEG